METTLHQELKQYFAQPDSRLEVPLGRYRIDIVTGDRLIEVQLSGLFAIRDKIRAMLHRSDLHGYRIEVIKPIVARKQLVKFHRKRGREQSRRWSPIRGQELDIVHELVHFTRVFPHPRLTLRVPLLMIEEHRAPRTRRRWRQRDYRVLDQKLITVRSSFDLQTHADLWRFVPDELEAPFDTGELAEALQVPRWVAQRYAYCLHKTGAARRDGKRGNAWLYHRAA